MAKSHALILVPVFGVACLLGLSCKEPPPSKPPAPAELEPFEPGDPSTWTCGDETITPEQITAWCGEHKDRGKPSGLPLPVDIADPAAKNGYDEALRKFLRDREYRKLGWVPDQRWRMTGPYVGPFGAGKSYGVHPAVRIWYSPEMVDWMCGGREGEIPDGAMIVKEMHAIKAEDLGLDPNADCMRVDKEPDQIEPESWTVMVRAAKQTHDGWYWANPTGSGDGNPPILDRSGVTDPNFFGDRQRNDAWYPTGDLFGAYGTKPSAVTPYSQFGAYCVNCHASAESHSTFSSLENVVGEGIRYRHFTALDPEHAADTRFSGAEHNAGAKGSGKKPDWGFTQPLDEPLTGWGITYGHLGPTQFRDALELRLPAETYDHRTSEPGKVPTFLTSNQCIGCHDATVSNDSTPNMLLFDYETGKEFNISPYAEWRASPMGLSGRDPIFFAQLQSETNNLGKLTACIENHCLRCHGVMGQRTFATDTGPDSKECRDLFGVPPQAGVPFGEPFRLKQVTQWGGEGGDPSQAKYGALARDGVSCTVCHHVAEEGLGTEASYTGAFLTLPGDEIIGPYADDEIIAKPMENALGITPKHAAQIESSELCSSCHNILLPVFSNAGEPYMVAKVNKQPLYFSYEQTTGLEWQNSVYSRQGHEFRSCQDCHMQTWYTTSDGIQEQITGIQIANIESDLFAPTTHRLPDEDITMRERDTYSRHTLHGLNIFQNQLFQQFPLLLGIRQIDYMGSTQPSTQPALVTAAKSIVEMARTQTASAEIMSMNIDPATGLVDVTVMVRNLAGHNLPSGVGFRRAFIELTVRGKGDKLLWASGRTNELGSIVDGIGDEPLPSESGRRDQTAFQPHYELITASNQVQIYQEVVLDSDGHVTTSFLRRAKLVKDNRVRPRGFDPAAWANHPSPYIKLIAQEEAKLGTAKDPYYTDPQLTGGDMVTYRIQLTPAEAAEIGKITVQLYNQSIPPPYLQNRFEDAKVGAGESSEIQRLYYMTSHLRADSSTPIPSWKLLLARDCKTQIGEPCDIEGELTQGL
jgi:hypothetical protein